MNKSPIVLFLFLILFSLKSFGQNLPEQNCPGAIPVCQPIYTQTNSYIGYGTIQELDANNQGCLYSAEKNDVWYVINVTTSGLLAFTITPNNISDDYDFGLWDITGVGCSALFNYQTNTTNNYLPLGCNYSGTPGATGLSNTITGNQWSPAVSVTAGQTLVLDVSNYSSTQYGYTLDFTPSTASIYDTVRPKFLNAGSHCGTVSNTINVNMSEPVKCNSLDANGSNLYVTPAIPGVTNIISASSINCSNPNQNATNSFIVQFSSTLPPGTYWLHAQMGNDNNSLLDNCSNEQLFTDSISFTMNVGTPPALTILDTPACIKARVILDRGIKCNSVAANGSDFYVTGPSNVIVTSATAVNCNALSMTDTIDITFSASIITPGLYTLHVHNGTDGNSLLDTCGVSVVNTISWLVSDHGITATASPYLLCNPGYTQLDASTSLLPSPTGYHYRWTPSTYVADSTVASTLAYVNQNRTFTIQMLDQYFCYRRDTANVTISIRNPILSPLPDTSICIGDKVHFNASGGINYAWYPVSGLSCTNCPNPIATPTQSTQYFVIISDQYNCSDTLSQNIIVYPLPVLSVGNDTTILYGDHVQLTAGLTNAIQFLWTPFGSLDFPNIASPVATPRETTTYTVSVVDSNQCKNSDSITVYVSTQVPVFVPSAFTPNGDGRNDVFRINNMKFQKLQEFRVFNRWGQEIFSTTDPNVGWDGTYKGTKQDSGVYNYLIRVSYPDGRVETLKGNVTLMR